MSELAAPEPVATQQDIPVDANPAHVSSEGRSTPPVEREPEIAEADAKAETEPVKDEPKKPSKSVDEALEKALKASQDKAKAKEEAKAEPDPKQPEPKKAESERAPDGKFAKKEPVDQAQALKPVEAPKTYAEAPARFHESAKAEWASAPESVRAEVTRAMQELERGLEKYRQQSAEYEEIKEYQEMAKQGGTTLKAALDNYVGIENKVRQNLMAGLEQIVQNVGLKKQDGTPVTLFDVAHSIVKQNPDARAAQQNSTISSLQSEIAQLKQIVQQTQGYVQEQRMAPGLSAVQEFAQKNPRFNEVSTEVAQVLNSGLIPSNLSMQDRLDRAYKTVIFNMDGELPSAHTASPPSAQNGAHTAAPTPPLNPAGQKSVSGAPSAVAPKAKTATGPVKSIDEALASALRKAS